MKKKKELIGYSDIIIIVAVCCVLAIVFMFFFHKIEQKMVFCKSIGFDSYTDDNMDRGYFKCFKIINHDFSNKAFSKAFSEDEIK